MDKMIETYMVSLTKGQVNDFALKNNCRLSSSELDFVYMYVKNNWRTVLKNPGSFNISAYKDKFSPENYQKISILIPQYLNKYRSFL